MADQGSPVVLIVEDNKVLIRLAEMKLRKYPVRIVFAGDGYEAVTAFKREYFDLILMDVMMPHMNGFDATKQIRELELQTSRSRTPIIGVTASENREVCLQAGMDDFIMKPADYDRVVAVWLTERLRTG